MFTRTKVINVQSDLFVAVKYGNNINYSNSKEDE